MVARWGGQQLWRRRGQPRLRSQNDPKRGGCSVPAWCCWSTDAERPIAGQASHVRLPPPVSCAAPSALQVLQQAARVCKPGGRLLLLEHGRGSYDWWNNRLAEGAEGHKHKWGCWWNRDILGIIDKVGRPWCGVLRWSHLNCVHTITPTLSQGCVTQANGPATRAIRTASTPPPTPPLQPPTSLPPVPYAQTAPPRHPHPCRLGWMWSTARGGTLAPAT